MQLKLKHMLKQQQKDQSHSVTEDSQAWTVLATGTTKLHLQLTLRIAWIDVPQEVIANSSSTTTRTTIAMLSRTMSEDAIQMIKRESTQLKLSENLEYLKLNKTTQTTKYLFLYYNNLILIQFRDFVIL